MTNTQIAKMWDYISCDLEAELSTADMQKQAEIRMDLQIINDLRQCVSVIVLLEEGAAQCASSRKRRHTEDKNQVRLV